MEAHVLQSFTAHTAAGSLPIEQGRVLIGAFDGNDFIFPLTMRDETHWAVENAANGNIRKRDRSEEAFYQPSIT